MHGLKARKDAADNVVIFKAGSSGYEDCEPVILQGHLDMVCEKEPDCDIDMSVQSIKACTDGKMVWADGTTLGADDGIAVAFILAVLASDTIAHPPIQAVLTSDEEIGMLGARDFDTSELTAKRLINIDSENEGILYVSCAGGVRAECDIPVVYEDAADWVADGAIDVQNGSVCFEVKIAGCEYGKEYKKDVSIRVITDHIRSVTFMASDGILPSNEGRGYVMRRLLRRAVRHGKLLGINGLFLKDLVKTVVDCNKCEYNELEEKYDYIVKVLTTEEQNFNATIDRGMKILDDLIAQMQKDGKTELDGESCFKLSDTYGFPIDLTREILEEKGMTCDEEGFAECYAKQRETAKNAHAATKYMGADETVFHKIDKDFHTEFIGYDKLEGDSEISFITTDDELIDNAKAGDEVYIVSSQTPFYAESGGQVGDIGTIVTESGKWQRYLEVKLFISLSAWYW